MDAADLQDRQLQAGVVVFSRRVEQPEILRAALQAAAQGFVLWPQEKALLKSLVERGMVSQAAQSHAAGNLHSVWAPKGGAGASVIAAHLAAGDRRLPKDSPCWSTWTSTTPIRPASCRRAPTPNRFSICCGWATR